MRGEVNEEMKELLEFVRKEQISLLYTTHTHSWLTHTPCMAAWFAYSTRIFSVTEFWRTTHPTGNAHHSVT